MIVQCSSCQTKFKIADDKVTERGVKVRCTRCGSSFVVRKGDTAAGPSTSNGPAARPAASKSPKEALHPNDLFGDLGRPADPPAASVPDPAVPPPVGGLDPFAEPSSIMAGRVGAPSSFGPGGEGSEASSAAVDPFGRGFELDLSAGAGSGLELDLKPAAQNPFAVPDESPARSPSEKSRTSKPFKLGPQAAAAPATPPPVRAATPLPVASPPAQSSAQPAPLPPPQRTRASPASVVLNLVIFLLLAAGAVGFTAVSRMDGPVSLTSMTPKKLMQALIRTDAPVNGLWVMDVSNGLYETASGRSLLFVRGAVENRSGAPAGPVKVVVDLESASGSLGQSVGFAGALPSPEDLYSVVGDEQAKALVARMAGSARVVAPGGRAPFVIFFLDFPTQFSGCELRIRAEVAAKEAADTARLAGGRGG